ncbi:MAG: hypothetical protein KKB31_01090, partial [Nanoarchaeota archaeon]|nr:hypothetical protein [Nanoarchaeota archaeon]
MNLGEFFMPGWIGLFITVIGVVTYYLGRVVLDFYPTKEDKALNHIIGVLLLLIYVAIPVSAFYTFS